MIPRLLFTLFICYLAVPASNAQDYADEHHFVEAWLDPAKASVGQQVTLNVMVGVDTYFTDSTDLAIPDIEHALVLQAQSSLNGGKNLQGKYFTTQTHQIDIYPDREGIMVVPAVQVTFTQAVDKNGEMTNQRVQLTTEQLLGLVRVPPAMAGESGFMVSSEVKFTDDWEGARKGEYKVGDVLTRVVTIVATDMASMNMPQFTPRAPRGVSVTLAEPQLSSTSGRADPAATMVQHMSYAIESPGQYTLGGETLSWWNPETATRQDHRFADKPVDAGGLPWRLIAIFALPAVVVLLSILALRRYLNRRDAVEVTIRQQLHSGDAGKRLAALYAYADHHQAESEPPARLWALLPTSRAVLEKIMRSRFSPTVAAGEPSRSESKSLYRQLKKSLIA